MLASELIKELKFKKVPNDFEDFEVSNVTQSTDEIMENSIFIAIVGYTVDGHQFISDAVKKGAKLVIASKPVARYDNIIYVNDTMKAMAVLAAKFYNNPSQNLKMIGVTGTNGKTTVTHMISFIFEYLKQKTGIIGTLYRKVDQKVYPTKNTTPDILTTQKTLLEMVEKKVNVCSMEVSSVALAQGRIWGIDFDVAVFLNFSQDHLDFHKTMANYAHAKSLLFSQLGNSYTFGKKSIAIFNVDDKMSKQFMQDTAAQFLTYGIENEANIRAKRVQIKSDGTEFDLEIFDRKYKVKTKTVGLFNVYNLLAAFSSAYSMGFDEKEIIEALKNFKGVKGRLQLISKKGIGAIIDYAHTPDGLLNVLETINDFSKGKVYCVVGCGGDRDKSKRPKMAKIAVQNSDYVYFTSDNPRSEDPKQIIDDMLLGVKNFKNYDVIVDRREAIQKAIFNANKDDIVLVAGKGHEDYQIIGKNKLHFDDASEVCESFKMKEKGK